MFIEFENAQKSIPIGRNVKGVIKVHLGEEFDGDQLTVTLKGFERTAFQPPVDDTKFQAGGDTIRKSELVIDQSFVIHRYPADAVISPGQYEYPFELFIPAWLNESVMLQADDNNLSLTFYLTSQIDARSSEGLAQAESNTSKLRTDTTLYLYKPVGEGEEAEEAKAELRISLTGASMNAESPSDAHLSKSMHVKVAGVAGLGSSDVSAHVSIEKDVFQPGELINITVDVDNSKCRKRVKSYKFKLNRRYECYQGNGVKAPILTKEEYLSEHKTDGGCAAKEREKVSFVFQIPQQDTKFGKVDNLHPDLRQMVKMFSTSISGDLFHISYHLDVFVKHDSWNEFGMGNYVSFPITIVSPERDLPFMKAKISDFETNIGQEWNATAREQIVQLSLVQNEDGSMTTQVTKNSQSMSAE